MKLGLVRNVASVVSFSALIFFGASFNAIARADDGGNIPPPENTRVTFTQGRTLTPRPTPSTPGHVQRCDVIRGNLVCSQPVALQSRPDHAAK